MIDYEKAQKADKLLLESGVPFMLVYDNTDKHMICRAFGNYPTLKEFIVTMMVQAVVNVQSKYGEDELANFRCGALLNGRSDDAEGMFEELKAYMAKHIAFVYTHDILGDKITESLKDIAVYSLIGLYMAELAKAEDEEVYIPGPFDDDDESEEDTEK